MNNLKYRKLISTYTFLFFSFITIYSQSFDQGLDLTDSTQLHIIELKSGERWKGKIHTIKNEKVFFIPRKTQRDTIFTLGQIKTIKVKGIVSWKTGDYEDELKYSNFVFYTNTAFTLKKGERMYRTFLGASILADQGIGSGTSIGFSISFPLMLAVNFKISGPLTPNNRLGFKTTFLSFPFLVSEDESFRIFENALIFTKGTPSRFFNLAYSNFLIRDDEFSFGEFVPKMYNSLSAGGGFRMNKNWQLIVENRVAFNSKFVNVKALPSFGISYSTKKFNLSFGYHSANELGLNVFPIMDFNEDDAFIFSAATLAKFPYFTYAKTF